MDLDRIQPKLIIPIRLLRQVIKEAKTAYPLESFGVLLGDIDGCSYLVRRISPLRRGLTARDFFILDLNEWMEAILSGRHEGLSYIGLYHSHPNASSLPSNPDIHRMMECPGEVWLIVALSSKGEVNYAAYTLATPTLALLRVEVLLTCGARSIRE